jgi:hypothetical protein
LGIVRSFSPQENNAVTEIHELLARVTKLENEVAQLQKKIVDTGSSPQGWVAAMTGIFADDPDFDEAVRLGREFCESQP